MVSVDEPAEEGVPELLQFGCPACRAILSISGAQAGIEGPCPFCATRIAAPVPQAGLAARRMDVPVRSDAAEAPASEELPARRGFRSARLPLGFAATPAGTGRSGPSGPGDPGSGPAAPAARRFARGWGDFQRAARTRRLRAGVSGRWRPARTGRKGGSGARSATVSALWYSAHHRSRFGTSARGSLSALPQLD